MRLDGVTALVTGANRGLGAAIVAALLAHDGIEAVYASARDLAQLPPGNAIPIELDVTDPASVARVAARCGDVGLLINNAAALANTGFLQPEDMTAARVEMETNYWGTLAMCRAFAPILSAKPAAAIVNILSIGALASIPFAGSYCASKAATWSTTQVLRSELRAAGVAVHAVFCGPLATAMARPHEWEGRAAPVAVAEEIILAIEEGTLDVFPDPVARDIERLYLDDPRKLVESFSGRGA